MLRINEKSLECSSGCESGWTMYLDQSFGKSSGISRNDKEDEEEDLSMVSDASSGPAQFIEDDDYCDENGCFCSASSVALVKKSGKRNRVEAKEQEQEQEQQHPSLLEDTASSHVFTFSKNSLTNNNNKASKEDVFDFSQGFSTTHFKGKPPLQKHFAFLNPTLPVKSTSTKPEREGAQDMVNFQSRLLLRK